MVAHSALRLLAGSARLKMRTAMLQSQASQVHAHKIQIAVAAHSAGRPHASTCKVVFEVDHRKLIPSLRKPIRSNVPSKWQAFQAPALKIQIAVAALPAG